jgi:outer membrane autotransporter protein
MNAQPIATKLISAFSSRSLALSAMLAIRAVSHVFRSPVRGPVSGRRLQYLLLPMLLCGLGAALPAQATVTQLANVVAPNTSVTYTLQPNGPTTCTQVGIKCYVSGYIDVTDANGNNITSLSNTVSSNECPYDGEGFYCNDLQYPASIHITWTPPNGTWNLTFSGLQIRYSCASTTGNCYYMTANDNLTTVVGTEELGLQVSAGPETYAKVGDVITYTYTLTNTGSLDLGATTVTDSRLKTISSCAFKMIAAGSPPVTCQKTYTVTQSDLDTGSLTSNVQASADSLYTSTSIPASAQVVVDGGVMQLQISAAPVTYSKVGEVITYTYMVTDSGSLPLDAIAVSDTKLGTIDGCGTSLLAGASTSCTHTYTITQADLDAGSLTTSGNAVASTTVGSTAAIQVTASAKAIVVGAVASGLAPGSDLTLLPNLTPNQIAVAGAVTDLCSTSTSTDVSTMCNKLYALTPAQIQDALQQMVPDQLAAQGTNAVETAFTQMSNISQRLLALRGNSGNTMLALNGLMLAVNGESIPLGMLADAAAASSNIANSGRLGGFVKGRIQLGSSDTTANAAGYDFNTKGLTAGVDYRLSDQVVLGGALGYANSKNDYSSSRGDMNSDGTTLSFYGSYYAPQDMYLDWIASYGNNNYDSTRNLVYSGQNTQALGSTDGRQLGLSASFGKDISRGAWLFTPYVRAEYVEAKINGYNESGGSGLALSYDDQTVHSFVSAAAARVSKTISARSGVYIPSAHLEWEHQYRNDQRMITARFVEDPSAPFQISTDSPDRNYFNLGLSMAATWPGGRSGFASYEMVLGQSNIRSYTFDFGVRQEF